MQAIGAVLTSNQLVWFKEQESKKKFILLPQKSKSVTQAVALQDGVCAQFIQHNTSNKSEVFKQVYSK